MADESKYSEIRRFVVIRVDDCLEAITSREYLLNND
jgi:hypothetical protein